MILQKEVEVTVNNNKINFYRTNGFPNCKRFDKIIIPIEWLGKTSKIEILCECDYCHKTFKKAYGELIIGRKNIEKDACYDCKYQKIQEVNYLKYGVKTNLTLPENKEKSRKTIIERYGVDNVMKNKEIREKQNQSLYEHYGVKAPIQNEKIKSRITQTKIQKYGTEYYKNGKFLINGVLCSKDQKAICEYFNFKINQNIGCYCVDGVKENLAIEYNGSGHNLGVKEGRYSQETFETKEKERIRSLLEKGYHILIIENPQGISLEKIHFDEISKLIEQLKNTSKIIYNISSTTIEN